jgi:ribosome-associated toxin RatA of RatAB toxin-antitoxin module
VINSNLAVGAPLHHNPLAGGGGERVRKLIFFTSLVFLLAVVIIPGENFTAERSSREWNPREMMAVTIDQSVLGPENDPDVLKALLEIGEVIIIDYHPEHVPWLASAGIIINAPIEKAYEAVTDFARYPEFMPQTEGARVKELIPDLYDVEFDIVVRIVYIPVKAVSAIYHYNQAPFRTDWAGKDPDYALNYGYWQLIPVDGGMRTMAFYTIYSRMKQGLARRLLEMDPSLEMMAAMSTATLVVRAMKDRAELLHQGAGGPNSSPSPLPGRGVFEVLSRNPGAVQYLASKGRVLILEEGEHVWTSVAVVFESPPEQVWDWLVNVEDQAGNDPHIKVKVLKRDDREMTARFEWEIYLVLTFNAEYTLQYKLDRPRGMTWHSIPGEGNVEGMRGSWDLIPLENGTRTLAIFRNTFDLRSLGFLMRALLRIESTFELAIQASQNLAVVDNLEQCLTLSPEQRQQIMERRQKALEDHRDLPLRDKIDLIPEPPPPGQREEPKEET